VPGAGPESYSERLTVPLRWWVQATMLLATVWLAFVVAMPAWVASLAAGFLAALTYGFFLWVGAARVVLRDGVLHAGRAHVDVRHLGTPEPLDKERTRRVLGVEADARAFLLTRPYLTRSVRVPVRDPGDPTPYWLLSTRHADRLAAALTAATHRPGGDGVLPR
jgi:hypothetical protein